MAARRSRCVARRKSESIKMRLTARLNKENHQIEIVRKGEHVVAKVDDRSYAISVREVADGIHVLKTNGNVFECLVEKVQSPLDEYRVQLRNRTFSSTIIDPRRLRGVDNSSVRAGDGTARISSPMAGKVVRVLVEKGTHIKAGDRIVVVEAMKMQNELKSPCDGVVTQIRAEAGSAVNAGDVLATIEAHV